MNQHLSTPTMPRVTFVVVNWNQRQLTLDCLQSLNEQQYPNFNIVLVDNGSLDDSVAAVRSAFPDVLVFENGSNLGIAAANNVGIRCALERESDYVFLLNNDTTVDPMMLSLLVATAESDPSIGATGPTMLYYDTPDIVWCAGNCIHWNTGSTHRLHSQEHLRSVLNLTARDVDFVTSCAVCIKSSAFRAIGLMDESYFIYYDETDWFARAQQAGWRVVHVPEALMWHKVSAAMGVASPATDYYMTRNAIRFVSKNGPGFSKLFGPSYVTARNLLAVAAYTLKSHQGKRSANRNARLLAIRDAMLGRWGKMGDDVARVCFPNR